jgi:hypothetical protein
MSMTDTTKKATVRDNTLVLYFDTAENPLVARFDLESLAQTHFEVMKKDASFALVLRDFSGSVRDIAVFPSKADAHQALYAILQALLEYDGGGTCSKSCCRKKRSLFVSLIKWFFILVGVAATGWLAVLFLTSPVQNSVPHQESVPTVSAPRTDGLNAPDGQAVDLDSVLPTDDTQPPASAP